MRGAAAPSGPASRSLGGKSLVDADLCGQTAAVSMSKQPFGSQCQLLTGQWPTIVEADASRSSAAGRPTRDGMGSCPDTEGSHDSPSKAPDEAGRLLRENRSPFRTFVASRPCSVGILRTVAARPRATRTGSERRRTEPRCLDARNHHEHLLARRGHVAVCPASSRCHVKDVCCSWTLEDERVDASSSRKPARDTGRLKRAQVPSLIGLTIDRQVRPAPTNPIDPPRTAGRSGSDHAHVKAPSELLTETPHCGSPEAVGSSQAAVASGRRGEARPDDHTGSRCEIHRCRAWGGPVAIARHVWS